jgi:hypothetical protein
MQAIRSDKHIAFIRSAIGEVRQHVRLTLFEFIKHMAQVNRFARQGLHQQLLKLGAVKCHRWFVSFRQGKTLYLSAIMTQPKGLF